MENTKKKIHKHSPEELAELNNAYRPLSPEDRVIKLYEDFKIGEIMLTSSFAEPLLFYLNYSQIQIRSN